MILFTQTHFFDYRRLLLCYRLWGCHKTT